MNEYEYEYRPRFSFEISEEQKKRADKLLEPYGIRKAVFCTILDDFLDLVEEYGAVVIGLMLSNKVKPREVLPSMKNAQEKGEKQNG